MSTYGFPERSLLVQRQCFWQFPQARHWLRSLYARFGGMIASSCPFLVVSVRRSKQGLIQSLRASIVKGRRVEGASTALKRVGQ